MDAGKEGGAAGSNRASEAKHARQQSRVAHFNQLSTAPTTFNNQRRRASSSASQRQAVLAVPAPGAPKDAVVHDPVSAESPEDSRAGSPPQLTRPQSAVSIGSAASDRVRDRALDAQPFPPTSATSAAVTPPAGSLTRTASSRRLRATTLDVPGLTRSKISPDGRIAQADVAAKLVVVMVGLPARGKSYITKKLCRYLNWQQHGCRIFNVGNTRRRANKHAGPSREPLPDNPGSETGDNAEAGEGVETGETPQTGDFFSPDNPESIAMREHWAEETLQELLDYVLDGDGSVGILDATNTTVARRKRVMNIINERSNGELKVLFLESVCTQREIIEANVRLKLSGPDYKHMDQKKAIADFLLRLHNYEKAYEPIGPEEEANKAFQYIKIINVGQKFECGNIKGFLAGQAVFFLLNINLSERQIWITRHGESTDNQKGRIGGDAGLTDRGQKYGAALARFMQYKKLEFRKRRQKQFAERLRILQEQGSAPPSPENEPEDQNFCVWTSMLRRTIETAEYFDENEFDVKEMRMLNEIDAGVFDGMTYEEIKDQFKNEYAARMTDKIRYRYPGIGGESYLDVINRLRPVIVEIERMEDNCLVICHRVIARILLSYFMNLGRDAIGNLEVPLHTLYVLEPKPYGVDWALYKYNERFNWFYEVSPEAAQVESQLKDHARRYTVVATAGMKLGDDSPNPTNYEGPDANAIASSDEDEDEDDEKDEDDDDDDDDEDDDEEEEEEGNEDRREQNQLHFKARQRSAQRSRANESLEQAVERRLHIQGKG